MSAPDGHHDGESSRHQPLEDDQLHKALKNVDQLESLFRRKLREIQSIARSLHGRPAPGPGNGSKLLEQDLEILTSRWNRYESSVDHLKAKYEHKVATDKVGKDLETNLDAYILIKQEVFGLLYETGGGRQKDPILEPTPSDEESDSINSSGSSSSSSIAAGESEDDDNNLTTKEKREGEEDEDDDYASKSCLAKYGLLVAFGIVAIIVVYFVFYLIISSTVKRRRLEEAG